MNLPYIFFPFHIFILTFCPLKFVMYWTIETLFKTIKVLIKIVKQIIHFNFYSFIITPGFTLSLTDTEVVCPSSHVYRKLAYHSLPADHPVDAEQTRLDSAPRLKQGMLNASWTGTFQH